MNRARKIWAALLSVLVILTFCPPAALAADDTITVSITVIGDSRHSASALPTYQTWIPNTSFDVKNDTTAWEIAKRAMDNYGMKYSLSAGYLKSVTAPAVWGGHTLAQFTNGNGSGWMYCVNDPGPSDPTEQYYPWDAITDFLLSDGDSVMIHYINDWPTELGDPTNPRFKGWFNALPYPSVDGLGTPGGNNGNGNGGGSSGGNGGTTALTPPKEYTYADLKPIEGANAYRLIAVENSCIKAAELKKIPQGCALYADMVEGAKTVRRIAVSTPQTMAGELRPATAFEDGTGPITALFGTYFGNKVRVLTFEQTADWGQTVEVFVDAAQVPDFGGSGVLYSYNRAENTYKRLTHSVDDNGYIRFQASGTQPIIFADGVLAKK